MADIDSQIHCVTHGKGKKFVFLSFFLLLGYACGIARKIMQTVDGSSGFLFFLSFFFYILNFVEILIDVALYFRNKKSWMNWPKKQQIDALYNISFG